MIVQVVTFMVMDSMLADCIDYDAMHTGRRAEAVYTVAEASPSHHGDMRIHCALSVSMRPSRPICSNSSRSSAGAFRYV